MRTVKYYFVTMSIKPYHNFSSQLDNIKIFISFITSILTFAFYNNFVKIK